MKKLFTQNLYFFFPYSLFLVTGGLLILLKSKAETHLFFNSFHNNSADLFFQHITFLGDGIFALIITIVFLALLKYRYAFVIFVSYAFSSLVTQLLKHTLFSDTVRPKKFFENTDSLYFIKEIETYSYNSFPSGHSTTAFALFFCLAVFAKNNYIKLIMFSLALTISFSRVYLSQHFFGDIYAGSLVGITGAYFSVFFTEKYFANSLKK